MRVAFPPHLRRFIELPETCEVDGQTIAEVIDNLDEQFPGLRAYLLHENGHLRKHVNIFLNERLMLDREQLTDCVADVSEITIMQALSGG